ncbi:hypothetical protein LUZ61_005178 [Rhynchospora tenuis]|uniref:DUF4408 domain-containing protein n=1 Tax=Rhynchospora tenuis TaxID=198213 RepID=A0AAD6EUD6_9POAL|nr:hypothetical protein LUZ61_005178 [Rhynchospora tenuis]
MNPLKSMVKYSRDVFVVGFFLSSVTWLPQVYHSLILFFSVSLPNIISVAVAPKCLFIVFHLIVIFLFGESKLGKCTKKKEIMHDYMAVSEKVEYFGVERKMLSYEISKETNVGIIQENEVEEIVEENLLEVARVVEEKDIVEFVVEREETGMQEDGEGVRECEEIERRDGEEMEVRELEMERENEEIEREEEEIEIWPAEEFNKKVEDFIAKVNMQFRLEARMAISCY